MAGLRSRQLVIEATMNSKGVVTGAKTVETTTEKMGRKVSDATRLLGGLGLAFGAGTIIQGLKDVIGKASDLEESVNAVEVATGDASDEIFEFGKTAAQEIGLSEQAVNDAAVAFSAFLLKIDPENVPQTFEDLITRAGDFASVMNLPVQEALLKFQSGLAGESEPLRKFGLDLSAASVSAYAVASGISESASKMTESEKVQARYGLLMEQTDKFAGDFAATADSLANRQRILNAEWANAQAELGQKLLPAMQDLQETGADLLPIVADLAGYFIDIAADAGESAATVGDVASAIGDATGAARDAEGPAGLAGDAWGLLTDNIFGVTNKLTEQGPGSIVGAFQNVHEWLSATDEELIRVSESMATNTAEDFADDLNEAGYWLGEVTGAAGGYRDGLDDVTSATDDARGATKSLADEHRKLVDPVFRAKKAEEEFLTTLANVREDGIVTADEIDNLAQKHLDFQAASEAVTPENMEAYRDTINDIKDDILTDTELMNQAIGSVGSEDNLAEFKGFIDRLDEITGRTFHLDLTGIRLTSQAELEQAITRAIYSLQRKGVVKNVML